MVVVPQPEAQPLKVHPKTRHIWATELLNLCRSRITTCPSQPRYGPCAQTLLGM